jgi:Arc/MetJ-type ribon-helix-helix transcriptional regulator
MNIVLPPEVEAQIRDRIDPRRYPDAETVIVKALEALDAQEHARFLKTRELILAGLNSGPGEELTDELWDRLEQEAEEAYQRGEKPSPHVCP